jgi:hypothetical protein
VHGLNRPILVDDAQARIIGRDLEMGPQRDHARINLDHRHARGGQMTMTKFDQRANAEADHHNPARAFAEQQKSHHLTGVGADQGVRLIEPHLSLDGAVNRKAQRSGFLILHQKGLVVTLIN